MGVSSTVVEAMSQTGMFAGSAQGTLLMNLVTDPLGPAVNAAALYDFD